MSRKASIAPAPVTTVVTIHSLNQALHPGTQGDESRSTTPGIEPQETQFLSQLNNLTFSHNFKEECCSCSCKTVLDLRTPDKTLVMQGLQKMACWIGTHENIEVFNQITNELVILIEFIGGGCLSLPNRIQVYGPPGFSVGFIERTTTCCSSSFEIQNAIAETIYTVHPSRRIFGPNEFPVIEKDGEVKVAEVITRASGSSILNYNEHLQLHPSMKALLIGFTFYLDLIEKWRRTGNNAMNYKCIDIADLF